MKTAYTSFRCFGVLYRMEPICEDQIDWFVIFGEKDFLFKQIDQFKNTAKFF